MSKKIFAIGDIHGCFYTLLDLIEKLQIDQDDQLVFLGDYIDRGLHSRKVVDYLIEQSLKNPHWIMLRGNHEDMLLEHFLGHSEIIFDNKTIRQWKLGDEWNIPQSHWNFFHKLKLFYETKDFIFVHAGINSSLPINEQSKQDLLWTYQINPNRVDPRIVVHGHRAMKDVDLDNITNSIGIDTGCVYSHLGKLTALELPKKIIHQVDRNSKDQSQE